MPDNLFKTTFKSEQNIRKEISGLFQAYPGSQDFIEELVYGVPTTFQINPSNYLKMVLNSLRGSVPKSNEMLQQEEEIGQKFLKTVSSTQEEWTLEFLKATIQELEKLEEKVYSLLNQAYGSNAQWNLQELIEQWKKTGAEENDDNEARVYNRLISEMKLTHTYGASMWRAPSTTDYFNGIKKTLSVDIQNISKSRTKNGHKDQIDDFIYTLENGVKLTFRQTWVKNQTTKKWKNEVEFKGAEINGQKDKEIGISINKAVKKYGEEFLNTELQNAYNETITGGFQKSPMKDLGTKSKYTAWVDQNQFESLDEELGAFVLDYFYHNAKLFSEQESGIKLTEQQDSNLQKKIKEAVKGFSKSFLSKHRSEMGKTDVYYLLDEGLFTFSRPQLGEYALPAQYQGTIGELADYLSTASIFKNVQGSGVVFSVYNTGALRGSLRGQLDSDTVVQAFDENGNLLLSFGIQTKNFSNPYNTDHVNYDNNYGLVINSTKTDIFSAYLYPNSVNFDQDVYNFQELALNINMLSQPNDAINKIVMALYAYSILWFRGLNEESTLIKEAEAQGILNTLVPQTGLVYTLFFSQGRNIIPISYLLKTIEKWIENKQDKEDHPLAINIGFRGAPKNTTSEPVTKEDTLQNLLGKGKNNTTGAKIHIQATLYNNFDELQQYFK